MAFRNKGPTDPVEETSTQLMELVDDFFTPLAQQYAFHPPLASGEMFGSPHVLILGNHSSGKSTFINHLIGRKIQKTGLAPTDDSFTLLAYAEQETEKDGQTVVGNPELPYEGLAVFGPHLLSHLKLKLVRADALKSVTMIDSPGMIDSVRDEFERGYDFTDAVRWFSERADLVVVFFDPDKPGTTGETMQIFAEALQGIDHKLLVVLNKVDQFETVRDFARAYGALCWNLARVIATKDLPHIYTTFVPVSDREPGIQVNDFELDLQELVTEIRRTPGRRIENLVTMLHDYARQLRMHIQVISEIIDARRRGRRRAYGQGFTILLVAAVWVYGSIVVEMPVWATGVVGGVLAIAAFVLAHLTYQRSGGRAKEQVEALDGIFERLYHRELALGRKGDSLRATWRAAKPRTEKALATLGLDEFQPARPKTLKRLNQFIEVEAADMRARLHRRHLIPAEEAAPELDKEGGEATDADDSEDSGGAASEPPEAETPSNGSA